MDRRLRRGTMATTNQAERIGDAPLSRMTSMLLVVAIVVLAAVQEALPCYGAFTTFGANSSSTLPFRIGFYDQSCPNAETIVRTTLGNYFRGDVRAPARIIRLFFHECFVTGCDASLLVNSTAMNQAEKVAFPNLSVAGYDIIDIAKAALESACPNTVSCADIEVLMTRDAVNMLGGPFFQVPTGRKDTRAVTTATQAGNTLPSDQATAQQVLRAFGAKGFTAVDTVTLLGAHTVGATFCSTFSYRLYNNQGTGQPTKTMDPALLATLMVLCPRTPVVPDPTTALDQGVNTINTMDNSYYQQLLLRHGILDVDQNLIFNPVTGPIVSAYAGNGTTPPTMNFLPNFANAIVKMSTLDVITGNSTLGSIRTNCAILN